MFRSKYDKVRGGDFEEPLDEEHDESGKESKCCWQAVPCVALLALLIILILLAHSSWASSGRHRPSTVPAVGISSPRKPPAAANTGIYSGLGNMVEIVKRPEVIKERVERMKVLDKVKATHCKGFHLDTKRTNWKQVPMKGEVLYYDSTKSVRDNSFVTMSNSSYQRKACHAQHPLRPEVTISIERSGPFVGNAGYDWRDIDFDDVAQLSRITKGKVVYVVGGMFAPVDRDGKVFGHPPFHIHHSHLYPYGSEKEVSKHIKHGSTDVSMDHHDVLIQSHGDSECSEAEGGVACLLGELPRGLGYRIVDSHKGFFSDSTVNDVRKKLKSTRPLEYYVEHVIYHTTNEQKPVTYFSMGNPVIPEVGPATYALPVDESSTLMYYRFPNSYLGGGGKLTDFLLHSHQTFLDSTWIFKGQAAYDELEAFRAGKFLPIILECYGYDLKKTKAELFKRLKAVAEAVCIVDHPNIQYTCKTKDQCGDFDKRMDIRCTNTSVSLPEGEVLTLVAFNKIKKIPGKTWRESREIWKSKTNGFSAQFAAFQHSIFRGVFIPDGPATLDTYVPPAYYYYATVAKDADPSEDASFEEAFKKLDKDCPANISFE